MRPRTMFGEWGFAGGLSGLLIFVGMYLTVFNLEGHGPIWEFIGAIVAWTVAIALMVWSIRAHAYSAGTGRRDRQKAPPPKPKVQQPTDFYYCDGCGNVFDPVSGRFVPLERAAKLFDGM